MESGELSECLCLVIPFKQIVPQFAEYGILTEILGELLQSLICLAEDCKDPKTPQFTSASIYDNHAELSEDLRAGITYQNNLIRVKAHSTRPEHT